MRKFKILILNWRCPKHPQAGGAEKATYEIARRWVDWGHYVHLISGGFPGGRKYDNIDGIRVTRLGGKYSVYPRSILHYCFNLKGKYDVVIDEINTIPFFTPLYVHEPHVAFIHQLAANVLFEELPAGQAKMLGFLEPHILWLYHNTPIFTSESTKEDLIKLSFSSKNLSVINYGVDHKIYQPGKNKSSYPYIFYLGRLKRFKGVHLLLCAMAQVVKENPNAVLTVVGDGDPAYKKELKRLTANLNLSQNVVFQDFGFHDSLKEKVAIMQEAWVLVFPSSREGFGLVVVEANACGTPTIAANVPGLKETVRDNETGLLADRNVDALASSIKRIINDEEFRENLSKKAFEWSMQFDWDRTARKMLAAIENIVDAGKNKV